MSLTLIIGLIALALILLFPVVLHRAYRAPRFIETATPDSIGLPYTDQYLPGPHGKRLYSWLIPAEDSDRTVIIVHGWGANMQMLLPLALPFHEAGMNVLLFDARNHGKSDGDSFSSMPRFAEDLDCAIDWTRERDPAQKIIVMGHSVGAAAALLAASRRDDINLVIGISGFAHPDLVMRRHLKRRWLPRFLVPIILRYVQWVIGHRFNDIAPMNRIRHIRCPVLLAHGTDDIVIPIDDMHLIRDNALPDNDLHTLAFEDAGHASVESFQDHAGLLIEFINEKLDHTHA
jgi:uncharacterized protein